MSCMLIPDRHLDLVLSAGAWVGQVLSQRPLTRVTDPEVVAHLTHAGAGVVDANRAAWRSRYREEPPARVAPYVYSPVDPPASVTAADVSALIGAVEATAYQLAEDVTDADAARDVREVTAWLQALTSSLVTWLRRLVSAPDASHWIWDGGGDAARWAPSDGVPSW